MTDQDPKTFRASLPVVGGVTRTTLPDKPGDPVEDLLVWIWAWRLQIERLRQSWLNDASGSNALEIRKSCARTSIDEHLVAVVGRQLLRAMELAQPTLPIATPQDVHASPLKWLRNLYEHWDKTRAAFQGGSLEGQSASKNFIAAFPGKIPWSITDDGPEWYLGGALPLFEFTRSLDEIEREALQHFGLSES